MRLGLLADIHEAVSELSSALAVLQDQKADQIVVLGDVVETGKYLQDTAELLSIHNTVGVLGNHDFGLAYDPDDEIRRRYSARVMEYMTSLKPRLEIENCLFSHVEPWLDATNFSHLWYFEGVPHCAEQASKSFQITSQRFIFVGHFHCWRIITPEKCLDWTGADPIDLHVVRRALISVGAVCNGQFGMFDTESCELTSFDLTKVNDHD